MVAINKYSGSAHGIGLLDIGVFMAASYKIIPGIVKILNSAGQIKTYEFTLNDLSADITDDRQTEISAASIHSVKFKEVSFKYRYQQVLNNLSFEIAPGNFVGISGPSGKGKTTIINLLLGFMEPDSGSIYINHRPLAMDERQSNWSRISYVKQQSFFINDTILKNIVLSNDDYNADQLAYALSFCGINSMLDQYPEGIDKLITENGKNISGGQRQRLMLARALYHDFDLMILDEPFSEMDEASEKILLIKLAALAKQGKMIIMITHNQASLSFCNKIISLDGE